MLSTANNHSLDTGYRGIESTIKYLDNVGISHTGTYVSKESQDTIIVENVNGINMAFLSFSYGTNGIHVPEGKEYCINLINRDLILNQINLAKQKNVDIICTFMHWGNEYELTPNNEQNELADFLFQNGVDIILGSHPHVLQKMEKRNVTLENGNTKEGFIIYSLGNFVSGQVRENTRSSIILNLTITKRGTGEITIDSANYMPIYTYYIENNEKQKYKIIDIKRALIDYENNNKYINAEEYEFFKNEYNKIVSIVGDEF